MGMAAASIADLDGLTRLGGEESYWRWHHTLGHNLPFGIIVSASFAALSRNKLAAFLLYLALFHLHLILDFFGSGPGWHIHYLWPMQYLWGRAQWIWTNPRAWEFYSWQNIVTFLALLGWTIVVAIRQRRTPLEVLMPSLDRQLIAWLPRGRVVDAQSEKEREGEGKLESESSKLE